MIPFLLTLTRDVYFYTVEPIEERENTALLKCLKKVISIYNRRGFYVKFILADGEFRHMTGDVMTDLKFHLNCTAAGGTKLY